MRDVMNSKKVFCRPINSKRKTREKVESVLNGVGDLVTTNMHRTGVLNAFFTLVFTSKTTLQESQVPETNAKVWSKEYLPFMKDNKVKECLKKLNIHRSMSTRNVSVTGESWLTSL